MLKLFYPLVLCATLLCAVACNVKHKNVVDNFPNDSLEIKFAHGFSIKYYTDYKLITVKKHANSADEIRYYLVKNPQTQTPPDGQKIVIPLHTIACGSATLYESLNLIQEINSVVAVTNAKVAYNQTIRNGINEGKITDLGDALNINVEKIMTTHPSALIMNSYNTVDVRAQQIARADIPVIYNNDWQENNVLGRAEWIKFVSAFFDKEKIADSIFSEIVNRYQSARNIAIQSKEKPTVMSGGDFRGTWYMPGGQSFMAQLFADAGADYFYKNNNSETSLPLTFETVLQNFANADFWLNCDYNSFLQLRTANDKNMLFKAAQQRNVWNFNRRTLTDGANDFWESAVVHPDLLLLDLIHIIHQQNDDYQLVYAKKVE